MRKPNIIIIILTILLTKFSFSQTYLAPIQDVNTQLWGFIDLEGKIKIPYKYLYVEEFSEGLALVFENNSDLDKVYTQYINSNGEIIINLSELDEACKFDMWGTFEYEKGFFSFNDGMAPFLNSENKWGFIDLDGNIAIPCQFDFVGKFSENKAYAIIFGEMTGYIGKDGSWQVTLADKRFQNLYNICDCIYVGRPFNNGVAVMTVVERTMECDVYETILIDKTGKIIYEKANQIGKFTDADNLD